MQIILYIFLFLSTSQIYAQTDEQGAPTELPALQVNPIQQERDWESLSAHREQKSIDFSEEITLLPNITRSGGSNRARYFQIRGLGDRGQFEQLQTQAVGVFYEGIDLSEEASVLPLGFDESLDVYYGPQSINWGGKALAGSFEVHHRFLPLREKKTKLEVFADSHHTQQGLGKSQVRLGKTEMLVGASVLRSDGYFENTYLDRPTQNLDEKNMILSAQTQLQQFSLRQTHLLAVHDNGYDAWSFNNSLQTRSDHPGRDRHRVNGHSLEVRCCEKSLTKWVSLTSLTDTRQIESYDEDWGNNEDWQQTPGWGQNYNYYSEFNRRRRKWHQKISTTVGSAHELGWHGSSYSDTQLISAFEDEAPRRVGHAKIKSENHALWWQSRSRGEHSELGAALRYEIQHVGLSGDFSEEKKNFGLVGAEVELKRKVQSDLYMISGLRRGYRGGGFNTGVDLPVTSRSFSPETLYEAQVGLQWKSEDVALLTRVFHYWHDDQQIQSSQQSDPTDPSTFVYFTDNAARSRTLGLESGGFVVWGRHRFEANVGWLQAEFRDYSLAGRDLRGRQLPYAPRWNGLLRWSRQTLAADFFLQLKFRDSFFYSEDHDYKSNSSWLTESGVKIFSSRMEWEIAVSNIFSQKHYTRAYYFANEPPLWENKLYQQPGPPQTVSFRWRLFL